MHPALSFDAFSTLPPTYKRVATSAARGEYRDLQRLASFARTSSETYAISTLPAFYANLNPSSIPSMAQLETSISASLRLTIGNACVALGALHTITHLGSFPLDASLDLWERAWPWLEFLHLYQDYIEGADALIDVRTYIIWCMLLINLEEHTETAQVMAHQPGVQALVTRCWMLTIGVSDEDRDEVFENAQYMLLLHPADPVSLAEIVAEAGGTFDHLAALVVRHLTQVIPRRAETVSFWSTIATFFYNTEYKSVPFKDALLAI
ncbi:MYND-type domain-containing protein [Mycena venus]|uniref:MYND-type domain-containing protein n=1 Tax=Mycena venus TaxID=2733690 RepID=A0A8H6Y932_9AGAR|nr:MYND-type domain-containing protein [Mycena venus]